MVIGEGLPEKVVFEKDEKEMQELAMQVSGGKEHWQSKQPVQRPCSGSSPRVFKEQNRPAWLEQRAGERGAVRQGQRENRSRTLRGLVATERAGFYLEAVGSCWRP